jgi:hypothetical protein
MRFNSMTNFIGITVSIKIHNEVQSQLSLLTDWMMREQLKNMDNPSFGCDLETMVFVEYRNWNI